MGFLSEALGPRMLQLVELYQDWKEYEKKKNASKLSAGDDAGLHTSQQLHSHQLAREAPARSSGKTIFGLCILIVILSVVLIGFVFPSADSGLGTTTPSARSIASTSLDQA